MSILKRVISLLFCLVMLTSVLASCGTDDSHNHETSESTTEQLQETGSDHTHNETIETLDQHTHTPASAVTENLVDSSCTATGSYDEVVYCSVCNEEISRTQKNVDKKAHDYKEKVSTSTYLKNEANCEDKAVYYYSCYCGEKGTYTFTDGEPNGHDFGEWGVTTEPTESTKGEKRRNCKNCDAYETDVIAELTHDHSRWDTITLEAVDPTCTETGLTEGKKCLKCGEILVAQKTVPANGHTYNLVITAPTCTEKGYTTYTCHCGDSYTADFINALGHTEVTNAAVDPTCTETGLTEGKKCLKCGEILVAQKTVSANGHTYNSVITAPTCTKKGYTTYTCHCGDSYTANFINALGHTEVTDAAVAPTCTTTGLTAGRHCSKCNITLVSQTVVGALGHNMINDMCDKCYYPYIVITTADELKSISDNSSGNYILTNDIDLGGEEWAPIKFFSGILNGNGFKISNFKITGSYTEAGLFGNNSGIIKNLGVEGFTINTSSSAVGGLAGYNNRTITNCYAKGSIEGYTYSCFAGGLVGYNEGTITDCYATGDVKSDSDDVFGCAGGLIGYNYYGTVTNCYATGKVTASSTYADVCDAYAGGLIAYNKYGAIRNCYATGAVESMYAWSNYGNNYAGGLIGYNYCGEILICYAIGDVSAVSLNNSRAGGLVGYFSVGTIENCYATGDVSADCYSNSYSDGSDVGGLVGYIEAGTIGNCYALGDISAYGINSYAGGLAGFNGENGTVKNAYAIGDVYAYCNNGCVGGLVGYNPSGTLSNCYRYSGQQVTVNATGTDAYGYTSTVGTAYSISALTSASFQKNTLGWATCTAWCITDGSHPMLNIGDDSVT